MACFAKLHNRFCLGFSYVRLFVGFSMEGQVVADFTRESATRICGVAPLGVEPHSNNAPYWYKYFWLLPEQSQRTFSARVTALTC